MHFLTILAVFSLFASAVVAPTPAVTVTDFLCLSFNLNISQAGGDGSQLVHAVNVSETVIQCQYSDGDSCWYTRSDGNMQAGSKTCPSSIDPSLYTESHYDCDKLNLKQSLLIGSSLGRCALTLSRMAALSPAPLAMSFDRPLVHILCRSFVFAVTILILVSIYVFTVVRINYYIRPQSQSLPPKGQQRGRHHLLGSLERRHALAVRVLWQPPMHILHPKRYTVQELVARCLPADNRAAGCYSRGYISAAVQLPLHAARVRRGQRECGGCKQQ
ncbi:hypothetical protein C8R47DRAFT_1200190 [Mycena vitilis]|nr:hypothetical protein C8R47DRAFT_1200190 [Mycena vitilis]